MFEQIINKIHEFTRRAFWYSIIALGVLEFIKVISGLFTQTY